MAKIRVIVGYAETSETAPGVWTAGIKEVTYSANQIRNSSKWQTSNSVNGNIDVNNQISILSDAYSVNNFQNIRYVKYRGAAWQVTSVEEQYPRLILNVGGVYDGEQA